MIGVHILSPQWFCGLQASALDQGQKQLEIMIYLKGFRIILFKRIKGVGVGGDDPFEPYALEGFHVLLNKELKKPFLTDTAHLMAGVLFMGSQNAEIDFRKVKAPHYGRCDILDPRIVGTIAVNEVEDIDLIPRF